MSDRSVRILNEPLSGQQEGEDGQYLRAEVYHVKGRGYVVRVWHSKIETSVFEGRRFTSEAFTLFGSSKSAYLEPAVRFNRHRLEDLAEEVKEAYRGVGPGTTLGLLRAEVLGLYHAEQAKRAEERARVERKAVQA